MTVTTHLANHLWLWLAILLPLPKTASLFSAPGRYGRVRNGRTLLFKADVSVCLWKDRRGGRVLLVSFRFFFGYAFSTREEKRREQISCTRFK